MMMMTTTTTRRSVAAAAAMVSVVAVMMVVTVVATGATPSSPALQPNRPVKPSPAWHLAKNPNEIQMTTVTLLPSTVRDGCGNDCYQPAIIVQSLGAPNGTNATKSAGLALKMVPQQDYSVAGFVLTGETLHPQYGKAMEPASTGDGTEPQIIHVQHLDCSLCQVSANCPSECLVHPMVKGQANSTALGKMTLVPDQTKEEAQVVGAPAFRFTSVPPPPSASASASTNKTKASGGVATNRWVPALVMSTECSVKVCGDNCPAYCSKRLAPGTQDASKLSVVPVHDKPTLMQGADGQVYESAGEGYVCHCITQPVCPCRPSSLLQTTEATAVAATAAVNPLKGETIMQRKESRGASTTLKPHADQTTNCSTSADNKTSCQPADPLAVQLHPVRLGQNVNGKVYEAPLITHSGMVGIAYPQTDYTKFNTIPLNDIDRGRVLAPSAPSLVEDSSSLQQQQQQQNASSLKSNGTAKNPRMLPALLSRTDVSSCTSCGTDCPVSCSEAVMAAPDISKMTVRPEEDSRQAKVVPMAQGNGCGCLLKKSCDCRMPRFAEKKNTTTKPTAAANHNQAIAYTEPAMLQTPDCRSCGSSCPAQCHGPVAAVAGVNKTDLSRYTVIPTDDTAPMRIESKTGCQCIGHPSCACRAPAMLLEEGTGVMRRPVVVQKLKRLLATVHRVGKAIDHMEAKRMRPVEALRFVSLGDQVKSWEKQPKKWNDKALHKALLTEEARTRPEKEVRFRTLEWGRKPNQMPRGKDGHLAYTLLPGEPPKTSLTDSQVAKVARIVISDAHVNKCAGKHEYADMRITKCGKKGKQARKDREWLKRNGRIDKKVKKELKIRKKRIVQAAQKKRAAHRRRHTHRLGSDE